MDPIVDLLLDQTYRKSYKYVFNGEPEDFVDVHEDDTVESMLYELLRIEDSEDDHWNMDNICALYKSSHDGKFKLLGVSCNKDLQYSHPPDITIDASILNSMSNLSVEFNRDRKRLLEDYQIDEDIIYVYDFKWFITQAASDKITFTNEFINGFIKKYWPFIDRKPMFKIEDRDGEFINSQTYEAPAGKESKGSYTLYSRDQIAEFKKNYAQLNKIYSGQQAIIENINNKFDNGQYLKPDMVTGFEFYHLSIEKNIGKQLDINSLFKNISLSEDLPVSMLHLENYIDSKFKLHREAVKKIPLTQFKRWKSGISLIPTTIFSHVNKRINTVTFHIKVTNSDGFDKKYAVINITMEGKIEIIIDKSTMINVSLKPDSNINLNLFTLLRNINNFLTTCKNYVDDITKIDTTSVNGVPIFFTKPTAKTRIAELGGRLIYDFHIKCGEKKDDDITKTINKELEKYTPYVRKRKDIELQNKVQIKRETLLDMGNTFIYKKVSNYTNLNNMEALVVPLLKSHKPEQLILYIMEVFSLDEIEANAILEGINDKFKDKEKYSIDNIEDGIACRLEDFGLTLELVFDNVKKFTDLQRMTLFIGVFLSKVKEFRTADISKQSAPEITIPIQSRVASSNSSSSSSSGYGDLGGGTIINKYTSNQIDRVDPNLINYKGDVEEGGYRPFSQKCPAYKTRNRQPFVIPDISNVKRIEGLWFKYLNIPYAFGNPVWYNPKLRNWRNDEREIDTDGKSVILSQILWIRTGTTYDNLNMYVCSRYWCVKCHAPLPDSYFSSVSEEEKKNTFCPFCHCGYFGLKDKKKGDIPDSEGTIIERTENYWRPGVGSGIKAGTQGLFPPVDTLYLPGYLKPHPVTGYIEDEPLLHRLPCCYKGPGRNDYKKIDPYPSCSICNHIYNPVMDSRGETEIPFDSLHNDWSCPGKIKTSESVLNPDTGVWSNIKDCPGKKQHYEKNAQPDTGRIVESPTYVLKEAAKGVVHPDIIAKINDSPPNLYLRYGVKSSGSSLLHSLSQVYYDDKLANKQRLLNEVTNEDNLLNFCRANDGDLVAKYRSPLSEREAKKAHFYSWLRTIIKSGSPEFKQYLQIHDGEKFADADSIDTWFVRRAHYKALFNIYTAWTNFKLSLDRMKHEDLLPLLLEMNPALYICLFVINIKNKKIDIVYPSREYNSPPKNIAYVVAKESKSADNANTSMYYEPIIKLEDSDSNIFHYHVPLSENEAFYTWCVENAEKDIINSATLPVFNNEQGSRLLTLATDKKKNYTFIDSLCSVRYIIIRIGIYDITLPINPIKMIMPRIINTDTGKYQLKQRYDLDEFIEFKDAKSKSKNPSYVELYELINGLINEKIILNKYKIQGYYVFENRVIGYSVNDGHAIFFSPVSDDDHDLLEFMKDKKLEGAYYFHEKTIDTDILSTEIIEDDRSIYKNQEINETVLYKQYKKEISSALSRQVGKKDIKELQKIIRADVYSERNEKYVMKAMWEYDRRNKIKAIVEKYTARHVKESSENPFEKWPTNERKTQTKCYRRTYNKKIKSKGGSKTAAAVKLQAAERGRQSRNKNCSNRPLCEYEDKTCKLVIGGKSYWNNGDLKDKFIEMLTDDIFYSGFNAFKILNDSVRYPDPRLSKIFQSNENEIVLSAFELRSPRLLESIFATRNVYDFNSKFNFIEGGRRRRTKKQGRKRKTEKKKKQRRTHRKKNQRKTAIKNYKRKTKGK